MDLFWIKTLANSTYQQGRWNLTNKNEVKAHNKMAVVATINEIYQDLVLSVNTYNEYVPISKKLKIFPLYCDQHHHMTGFLLIVRNIQIRLERSGGKMEAILESTQGFRQHREYLHTFSARMDALGGLTWIMDQQSVVTNEMIVKQILHDLCSTAYELTNKQE